MRKGKKSRAGEPRSPFDNGAGQSLKVKVRTFEVVTPPPRVPIKVEEIAFLADQGEGARRGGDVCACPREREGGRACPACPDEASKEIRTAL